jgi:hypothetical protein
MYIYAEKITPRLSYVIDTLFAGTEVVLTSSPAEFYEYDGAKINYSKKRFSDKELLVYPNGLLFETGIRKQVTSCSEWEGLKIFFRTQGDIPFDIFSAAFYLLGRYEEYLPHKKDGYGRFAHEESLAFKEGFLQLPLVDLWRKRFFELLEERFFQFQTHGASFAFTPTYDIDIAYAYEGRGILRKMISRLRKEETHLNGRDVFDVYEWLGELHKKFQLLPAYFFLLAHVRSRYDKNLSPKSGQLQQLIRKLAAKYAVGIHPSWQSYWDEHALQKEICSLREITGKTVIATRQHYIQFTLPHTFRSLIAAGLASDYSMGYGSINGFRASSASSFFWYDLVSEETTSLLLHPFCYMDANSCFEQKFTAEEAANELQHYHDVVKQVNGHLITVFHNHFLTEQPRWQPWRKMYEEFLENNLPGSK